MLLQNTTENVFIDLALCKVAWINHTTVMKLDKSPNLLWGWEKNYIFYRAIMKKEQLSKIEN